MLGRLKRWEVVPIEWEDAPCDVMSGHLTRIMTPKDWTITPCEDGSLFVSTSEALLPASERHPEPKWVAVGFRVVPLPGEDMALVEDLWRAPTKQERGTAQQKARR